MRLGVSRTRGDPGKARQRLLTSWVGGDKISAIPTEEFSTEPDEARSNADLSRCFGNGNLVLWSTLLYSRRHRQWRTPLPIKLFNLPRPERRCRLQFPTDEREVPARQQ